MHLEITVQQASFSNLRLLYEHTFSDFYILNILRIETKFFVVFVKKVDQNIDFRVRKCVPYPWIRKTKKQKERFTNQICSLATTMLRKMECLSAL